MMPQNSNGLSRSTMCIASREKSIPKRPTIARRGVWETMHKVYTAAVNIVITSFQEPVDTLVLERAFKGIRLGTCISITNTRERMPHLDAQEHLWMEERVLREGHFTDVNWNSIAPLDEELIERMRSCECVFLSMAARYTHRSRYKLSGEMPFSERQRQYFSHLRYWNDFLDTRKIDIVLMYHLPHKCYDWVLYHLCKLKRIPLLYVEHLVSIDTVFMVTDWEESSIALRDAVTRVTREYADPSIPVPLSDKYQWYFENYRREIPVAWYKPTKDALARRSFVLKWRKKAIQMLARSPRAFFRAVLSRQFWSRKLTQHKTIRFYDSHARIPDLSLPYIYVPLHLQPEATTLPLAGAYADQERSIQLIAAHLPKHVRIYVKEHPAQGERWRSIAFYKALLALPCVTLVPRDMNTFELLDRAIAVATATGTAGFEGFMRQKPVLMFGHIYYQYAPGIHRIRTSDDCKRALDAILSGTETTSERDVRLFLKAMEECATPYPGPQSTPYEEYSQDEKTTLWAELIRRSIEAVAPHQSA